VKLQFKKRRLLPVALAILVLVVGSGVAYAYWTSGGSNSGSAGVGTSQALTVSQTGSVTGLVPAGLPQDVTVHVVNPASFSQSLSAVVISVHAASLPTNCLPAWFTVTQPTILSPIVLAATGTAGDSINEVGQIQMIDSGTNQNPCQGAALTLDLVVS
jgi:hypothetical protein